MGKGWYRESNRHALAAKGVKTAQASMVVQGVFRPQIEEKIEDAAGNLGRNSDVLGVQSRILGKFADWFDEMVNEKEYKKTITIGTEGWYDDKDIKKTLLEQEVPKSVVDNLKFKYIDDGMWEVTFGD